MSVVVCPERAYPELDDCLGALAAQRYPHYDVLVVDRSADGGAEAPALRWGARHVAAPGVSLSAARNLGTAAAGAPLLAFTSPEARPDPLWLAALAAGFFSEDIHAVTGPVVPAELETPAQLAFDATRSPGPDAFSFYLHSRRGRPMAYKPHRYGSGDSVAFRRDVLVDLGGFDPALDEGTPTGRGGDLDLLQRLVETGAAVAYRPDALVRRVYPRTFRALRRLAFNEGRGYSAMLAAAFARARGADRVRVLYAALLWFYGDHFRRAARRLLRRDRGRLSLFALAGAGALCGPLLYILARRRARRTGRLSAD